MPKLDILHLAACLRQYAVRVKAIASLPRSRLGFKLLTIVISTVLLGTVFSSGLILSLQRQQLTDSARTDAQRVGAVIRASLEHAMLSNDLTMLDQMLKSVASETGLARVRILDADSRVWLSSVPAEVGWHFRQDDPLCTACHSGGIDAGRRGTVSTSQIAGEALLSVNVIPNQPACHSCHKPDTRPLGLLLIETPLADLHAQLTSGFWRIVFSALITIALLIGLLTPLLGRLVIQPVVQLARGATEIGAGNLDCQVQVESNDELGELAKTFDTMRQQLKAELREKEQRNLELQTLNEIALATSQLLDPQQILDLTINIAVSSLGVEAGAIYLLNRECDQFTLHACQGMPQCLETACHLQEFSRVLAGLEHPDSQVVSVLVPTDVSCGLGQDPQGRSYVGVPLKAQGVLLGAMTFITRSGQVVTREGTKTLKAMGEEIGLALANAIRFQNARYQATLEERERLAREMHDSLAQALGYLKLKASITDELLSGGQIAKAQANLREVKEIAGKTYFDVREAIFGLRHTASSGAEFLPALEEYLTEYRTYYGLNVQVVVNDGERPSFPAEASIQLTRIIQEALTNVRKHAKASQANIRFERENHRWCITVEDNGEGFDPTQVAKSAPQFFGLQIMRERAESIGAKLEIDSLRCRGTRVIVRMPAERED